jgi:hypothetical protein
MAGALFHTATEIFSFLRELFASRENRPLDGQDGGEDVYALGFKLENQDTETIV